MALQFLFGPHARQHQQLRGLEGPGGEDDFPLGTQGENLTVLQHLDSHGASAFK
ncbi:hypothetical protein D9M73_249720 [compost metagenome]